MPVPEKKRSAENSTSEEEEIRIRAYELFQERGEQPGYDAEDWLRAEDEVRNKHTRRKAA